MMAVFLLTGLSLISIVALRSSAFYPNKNYIFDRENLSRARQGSFLAYVASSPRIEDASAHGMEIAKPDIESPLAFIPASLDNFGMMPAFPRRTGIATYKVGKGDSFIKIAGKFGVSVDTILRANLEVNPKRLGLGAILKVPQVSGEVYSSRDGDTLESIAELFGVSLGEIRDLNRFVNPAYIPAGTNVVVPGAFDGRKKIVSSGEKLRELKNYFSMPASGFNWGRLHSVNAVDIAGVCGTPVVAAAEGLVVPDDAYDEGREGWNGGYGIFVLLEHPLTNIKTRYAHLRKSDVGIGDYVKQGQQIGEMGDTGDASRCEVHFEVFGAANPFVK